MWCELAQSHHRTGPSLCSVDGRNSRLLQPVARRRRRVAQRSPRLRGPEPCVADTFPAGCHSRGLRRIARGASQGVGRGLSASPAPFSTVFERTERRKSFVYVPRASHLIRSAIDVENIDRQRAHRNVARQPDRPPRPETRSGPSPPPEPRPQYMSGGIEYISSGGGPPRGADLGRFVVPMEARIADFSASAAAAGDGLDPPHTAKERVRRDLQRQRHLHRCGLGHVRSASIACNCFKNRNDAAPERLLLLLFSPVGGVAKHDKWLPPRGGIQQTPILVYHAMNLDFGICMISDWFHHTASYHACFHHTIYTPLLVPA